MTAEEQEEAELMGVQKEACQPGHSNPSHSGWGCRHKEAAEVQRWLCRFIRKAGGGPEQVGDAGESLGGIQASHGLSITSRPH